MGRATYITGGLTGGFNKNNMNNQFHSLFQGDSNPLRARAQSSPDMTLQIATADVESFYKQVWLNTTSPDDYAGGNSSAISAPAVNPRIDLLYMNTSGTLVWITGTESASPTAPDFSLTGIPICYVYCKTTMTKIVNYEDKDSNPNEGYIYKDVRPRLVNPLSSLAPDGYIFGFEHQYFAANSASITFDQGIMVHGLTTVKTTSAFSPLVFDTAGNYYDGNLPSYDPTEGWNYIGIDTAGDIALLGTNERDVSSYVSDDSQGSTSGRKIYFWDAGNTKHWRVVGAVRCKEVGGVIKAVFGQLQTGNRIMLDIPVNITVSATSDAWSAATPCAKAIPAISTLGVFGMRVGKMNSHSLLIVIRPNGTTWTTGYENSVSVYGFPTVAHSTGVGGQRHCMTDTSQQIQYYTSTGASISIDVEGYVMNIR